MYGLPLLDGCAEHHITSYDSISGSTALAMPNSTALAMPNSTALRMPNKHTSPFMENKMGAIHGLA